MPRLQALETRDLFHQQNSKGKIVMTNTSRYKGLVLGSFLVPEIDLIFGDGVGATISVWSSGCNIFHCVAFAGSGLWILGFTDLAVSGNWKDVWCPSFTNLGSSYTCC